MVKQYKFQDITSNLLTNTFNINNNDNILIKEDNDSIQLLKSINNDRIIDKLITSNKIHNKINTNAMRYNTNKYKTPKILKKRFNELKHNLLSTYKNGDLFFTFTYMHDRQNYNFNYFNINNEFNNKEYAKFMRKQHSIINKCIQNVLNKYYNDDKINLINVLDFHEDGIFHYHSLCNSVQNALYSLFLSEINNKSINERNHLIMNSNKSQTIKIFVKRLNNELHKYNINTFCKLIFDINKLVDYITSKYYNIFSDKMEKYRKYLLTIPVKAKLYWVRGGLNKPKKFITTFKNLKKIINNAYKEHINLEEIYSKRHLIMNKNKEIVDEVIQFMFVIRNQFNERYKTDMQAKRLLEMFSNCLKV